MSDWPPLRDEWLLERLRVPDEDLWDQMPEFLARISVLPAIGGETFDERREHGRGYPWSHPSEPCVVIGDEVHADAPLTDGLPRYRLMAFGSNGNPERLAGKFHDLEVKSLRIVPGKLHDFDVCALPTPSPYMAMPAGIAPSPGTIVDVAVLEVTAAQYERLTLTEFGYWPGRIDGIVLETADGGVHNSVLAYNQRLGLYAINGEPVALAAVKARNRRFLALSQEQLLTHCAQRTVGPSADSFDICLRLFEDADGYMYDHYQTLGKLALHVDLPGWVTYPLEAAEGSA